MMSNARVFQIWDKTWALLVASLTWSLAFWRCAVIDVSPISLRSITVSTFVDIQKSFKNNGARNWTSLTMESFFAPQSVQPENAPPKPIYPSSCPTNRPKAFLAAFSLL
jgi:hypothetical protein